ncbi:MAG: hypothetical protein V4722_03145 [Bacteroidota bacterium]
MRTCSYLLAVLLCITTANAQSIGIGTATPSIKAALEIKSTTKGFLPPRMDSTAKKAITSPPPGLVIYNTSINGFECFNGIDWYSTVHFIGESYGGGIVFYVYDNGQHGLIAAPADLLDEPWYNGTPRITGSSGDGLAAGAMNTVMAVVMQVDASPGTFAAKKCADLKITMDGVTYGDWYLPSQYELNLLWLKKNVVGGFKNLDYWSSTEWSATDAVVQHFQYGTLNLLPKYYERPVRAIRAF